MTFLRLLGHLVTHDLRTHAPLIAAWVALVLVQPLVGTAIARDPFRPTGDLLGGALFLARLVLGTVVAATLIQSDRATTMEAFWKARPIAPALMAASRLGLVAVLLLVLPLVVVLACALTLDVPLSAWPGVVFEVVRLDGFAVGLAVAAASRTQRVPTMILAVIATLLALAITLIAVAEVTRAPALALLYRTQRPRVDLAMMTVAPIVAVAGWALAALAWFGARARLATRVIALVTLTIGLAVVLVPTLHRERVAAALRGVRMSIDATEFKATPSGSLVWLSVPVALEGLPSGVEGNVGLVGGWLEDGPRRLPVFVAPTGLDGQRQPWVSVGRLRIDEYQRWRGQVVRLRGRLRLDATDAVPARLHLDPGQVVERPGLRLRVLRGAHDSHLGRLEVRWVGRRVGGFGPRETELSLRSGNARRRPVIVTPMFPRWSTDSALLPTLATPFGLRHVVVDAPPGMAVPPADDAPVTLDVVARGAPIVSEADVDVALSVP